MKEKNVFENAKFGDKFICKNGRIALYISPSDSYENESIRAYSLTIQYQGEFDVLEDGRLVNSDGTYGNDEFDIVSRYQEPLNHAELNAVIDSKCWEYENGEVTDISYRDFGLGFKDGCKYALGYDG